MKIEIKIEETESPRQGWFNNIDSADSLREAKDMEKEFQHIQSADLDNWNSDEEW